MPQMEARDVLRFITDGTHGKFFSVRFRKRTTGETRDMVAKYGVRSRLKGGEAAYSFSDKGLVCVWDCHKKDYRSIPTDGLLSIKIDGVDYEVVYPTTERL